jgi:hypothetical protein
MELIRTCYRITDIARSGACDDPGGAGAYVWLSIPKS